MRPVEGKVSAGITEREHGELVARVGRGEQRMDRMGDDIGAIRHRLDLIEGMAFMLRLIFGTSIVAAVAGILALIEVASHFRV